MRRVYPVRKLLAASIGVAAISYGACSQEHIIGNLMGPPSCKTDADCVAAGRPDLVCKNDYCSPSPACEGTCPADSGSIGLGGNLLPDAMTADEASFDADAGDSATPLDATTDAPASDADLDATLDGATDAADAAID